MKHPRLSVDLFRNGTARIVVRCHGEDESPATVVNRALPLLVALRGEYTDTSSTAIEVRVKFNDTGEES